MCACSCAYRLALSVQNVDQGGVEKCTVATVWASNPLWACEESLVRAASVSVKATQSEDSERAREGDTEVDDGDLFGVILNFSSLLSMLPKF